jgi:hypothetical protein
MQASKQNHNELCSSITSSSTAHAAMPQKSKTAMSACIDSNFAKKVAITDNYLDASSKSGTEINHTAQTCFYNCGYSNSSKIRQQVRLHIAGAEHLMWWGQGKTPKGDTIPDLNYSILEENYKSLLTE